MVREKGEAHGGEREWVRKFRGETERLRFNRQDNLRE